MNRISLAALALALAVFPSSSFAATTAPHDHMMSSHMEPCATAKPNAMKHDAMKHDTMKGHMMKGHMMKKDAMKKGTMKPSPCPSPKH